jgi:hypothetical protein
MRLGNAMLGMNAFLNWSDIFLLGWFSATYCGAGLRFVANS